MGLLAVLEFVVGGIVVLGGAALFYFSIDPTGMSLGIVHASVGLMAFPVGYLLLSGNARARTLVLGVDVAIIAFSTTSEIILFTTNSLPSGPFAESVIGTTVAVLIAALIVYQLMRAQPQLPAGGQVQCAERNGVPTGQSRGWGSMTRFLAAG